MKSGALSDRLRHSGVAQPGRSTLETWFSGVVSVAWPAGVHGRSHAGGIAAALLLLLLLVPLSGVAEENAFKQFWSDMKANFDALGEVVSDADSSDQDSGGTVAEAPAEPEEVAPASAVDVRFSQDILNRLGYRAGTVDGVEGPRTARAITAYGRDRDLQLAGKVDAELLAVLRQEHPPRRPKSARHEPKAASAVVPRKPDTAAAAVVVERENIQPEPVVLDVRSFEFRGIRLGDTMDRVNSVFTSARIEPETQSRGDQRLVKSYYGFDDKAGVFFRFDRERRLYRFSSGQVIQGAVSIARVRERLIAKYGAPNGGERIVAQSKTGRMRWITGRGANQAGLEVTVQLLPMENITRVNTRLWDDRAASRNEAQWVHEFKSMARVRDAVSEVEL